MNTAVVQRSQEDTLNNLNSTIAKMSDKGIDLSGLQEFLEQKNFDKKVLLIGGSQISGSLSPFIHTFSACNNDDTKLLYTLFDITKTQLSVEDVLDEIEHSDDILGSNVTMPFKVDAFDLLKAKDKLDSSALLAGAVNTVSKVDGELRGFNTDVEGIFGPIFSTLSSKELSEVKTGYIVGAGGAAKASIAALLKFGITNIVVFNRSDASDLVSHFTSENVADILRGDYGVSTLVNISVVKYDVEAGDTLSEHITDQGILINTLPFGFKENLPDRSVLVDEIENIKDEISLFFDVVYDMNHGDTPMIQDFKQRGIPTCDGRDMLVGQALKGFELWTKGGKIDTKVINSLLRN